MRALNISVVAMALALCSAQSPAALSRPAAPSQPSSSSQLSPSPQPAQVSAHAVPATSSVPLQPSQPSVPPQFSQPGAPSRQSQLSPSPQPLQPSQLSPSPQPTHTSPSSPPHYSANGLYNLANSYARAGQPGLAVLNYERAALLAPYDADIAANLDYVRSSAHVPTAPPQGRFARIAVAMSPTLTAWLGVVGIALVGATLLANRVSRRMKWITPAGVLLGAALIALPIANAMLLWPRLHEAVVLINQTPALVSPVPIADTAFVLPEAETVVMTAKHDDFILVRTRGGLSGWVTSANLGAVVPEAN
jgi:hypothetical protein